MKNVKYVLTLSKDSADRGAYLVFISKEGKTFKTLKYNGCSTLSINKDNGEFVIHSHKRNEYYRFTKEGKFKPYSLLKNKYIKEDWEGMASNR